MPQFPSTQSASGIWPLKKQKRAKQGSNWPMVVPPDEYFNYVSLLTSDTGVNGAQNNTFIDSSTNNFTITRNGNATQGTFSPYGANWSNYFNGSSSILTVANNTNWVLGTAYTIECWVYFNSFSGYDLIVGSGARWWLSRNLTEVGIPSGAFGFSIYTGSAWQNISSTTIPVIGTWYHVAATVSNGVVRLFVNGIQEASATMTVLGDSINSLDIGSFNGGVSTYAIDGYLSNLRLVKGSVVYTSNFTPTTTPLAAITNTVLLTCQSNRFVDNSINAYAISPSNSSVQRFSPFPVTVPYIAETIGGSGYFDGGGDWVTTPNVSAFDLSSSSTDFTIEAWVYNTGAGTYRGIFGARQNEQLQGWCLYIHPNNTLYMGSTIVGNLYADRQMNTTVIPANAWAHVALVKTASGYRAYVNGVGGSLLALTGGLDYRSTQPVIVGALGSQGEWPFLGFISNARIVKGTAVYTSNFTPSNTPLTAIANTSLLLNFTNAGIINSAMQNNLETQGNAQVSTSVTKYVNSMYFDGSGDCLTVPLNDAVQFRNQNFTIEAWIYPTTTNHQSACIFSQEHISAQNSPISIAIWLNGGTTTNQFENVGNNIGFGVYNGTAGSTWIIQQHGIATIPINTWTHIALSRVDNDFIFFVNGSRRAIVNNSTSCSLGNTQYFIGRRWDLYGSYPYFTGYISEFRITKGYARYWSTFTPPTIAMGTVSGTITRTSDPEFSRTVLLLDANGTNGAQNNTFINNSSDSGLSGPTRNGNTTQGSFSPYGANWSNYFDGTGDYLDPGLGATTLSTNWTFEAWIYPMGVGAVIFDCRPNNTNGYYVNLSINSDTQLNFYYNSVSNPINTSNLLSVWTHVAVVKNGSNISVYVNGVSALSVSDSNTWLIGASRPRIGANGGFFSAAPAFFTGFMSNLRVVNGTAVYTANFTPPTAPLTAITNTSLLTCQSNRFRDNSTNNFAITRNGDVSVQRFSPFNPSASYSVATIGGSAYFDGSGDFLETGSFISTQGNFTFDVWVYPTSLNSGHIAYLRGNNNGYAALRIEYQNGQIILYMSTNGTSFAINSGLVGNVPANAWSHIAVVRNVGTITMYVNGISVFTSTTIDSNTALMAGDGYGYYGVLRSSGGTLSSYFTGYMSDLRVVGGSYGSETAVYTGAFTPPTAPLTTVPNPVGSWSITPQLLNFTNAGIVDKTMMNNLETVGNAQISTAQSKFGGGSILFDGSTSSLAIPYSPNYSLDTHDFTIEGWFYFTNLSTNTRGLIALGDGANGSGPVYNSWSLRYLGSEGSNQLSFYRYDGSEYAYTTSGLTLAANTWTHIAVSRASGTLRIFVNGVSYYSAAVSQSFAAVNSNPLRIALQYYGPAAGYGGPRYWPGYIDDLRITKGYARYVQTFTPPNQHFTT